MRCIALQFQMLFLACPFCRKELFFQIQIHQYLSARPVCQSKPLKKFSQMLQLPYASTELKYTDVQNPKGIFNEAMV